MMLSILTSFVFLTLKHPMSMGMTLLIQSLLTALCTGYMTPNFWFSYIIFLIMIGGMLVLFIYMTSIAANEKFHYSNSNLIFIMMFLVMMLLIILSNDSLMASLNMTNWECNLLDNSPQFSLLLSKYINFPSNVVLYIMIIYLFVTLIAIVKITNINYGPLRQKS
uniref:NADH-ubiquinone oxidoreductase chain 6 n=1 Tax=Limnichidae sp. MJTNT-2012 TaxID=1131603 RepID=H6W8K3_9COLE|nr:NADH dehydrogenase subunit 6 [Limnichidae sp. MJTNT-2012]